MELGRCPRCSRPYTASEVVGFGVLRSRAASAGGPRMEFACPDCARKILLVPHGEGRYAPPGEPPPRNVPEAARRPPWYVGAATSDDPEPAAAGAPPQAGGTGSEPPPAASRRNGPEPGAWQVDPGQAADPGVGSAAAEPAEVAMGPAEALALLGCKPTAEREEIEHAFRERSRTCHPDKVAHLDADFQALAERKFKRLRQALDILTA